MMQIERITTVRLYPTFGEAFRSPALGLSLPVFSLLAELIDKVTN